MKAPLEASLLSNLIVEYEKRFGHPVPGQALRSYPRLLVSLEQALESGNPIKQFADHRYDPSRTDQIYVRSEETPEAE
jgi:hypothetical protein